MSQSHGPISFVSPHRRDGAISLRLIDDLITHQIHSQVPYWIIFDRGYEASWTGQIIALNGHVGRWKLEQRLNSHVLI